MSWGVGRSQDNFSQISSDMNLSAAHPDEHEEKTTQHQLKANNDWDGKWRRAYRSRNPFYWLSMEHGISSLISTEERRLELVRVIRYCKGEERNSKWTSLHDKMQKLCFSDCVTGAHRDILERTSHMVLRVSFLDWDCSCNISILILYNCLIVPYAFVQSMIPKFKERIAKLLWRRMQS